MTRKQEGRKPRRLSPKNARSYSDLLRLARTACDTKKSWFLLCHNGIAIHVQESGKPSTGQVFLSRCDFEAFVRFYERAQKVSP